MVMLNGYTENETFFTTFLNGNSKVALFWPITAEF